MTTTTRDPGPKNRAGTPRPAEVADRAKARRRHPTGRRVRPPRADIHNSMFVGIAFVVAVLNLLGLVMVLSASSIDSLDRHGTSWYYVSRQAIWSLVGAAALVACSRIDYHRWRRMASPLLWVALSGLVAVFIPGLGVRTNGAQRWLGTGWITVQPSEMVKLALVVWVADLLARRSAWMHNTRATLRPVVVVLSVIGLLVMLQPNLGTTLVIAAIALSLAYVAGVPFAPLLRWGGTAVAAATVLALLAPYRLARVLAFLDPWDDPLGQGYQQIQSLVGLATGGVSGTGLGTSRAKWGFLPYAHTDFIFSIIGEELGLIGALVVVVLFVLLGILGIRTALHAPDRFGMLLAVGVTAWFLVQAFINIGAVIGLLPVTGVPLPFLSFGGSSLLFTMAGVGMLLSVARCASPPAPGRPAARQPATRETST